MRRILLVFVTFFLFFALYGQDDSNTGLSTYYLIRHAEKKISEGNDPDLHIDGIKRSEQWAVVLGSIKFDAIYSTDYIRTRETVKPTAEKNSLEIILYDDGKIDYKQFLNDTKGKNVLIVGHSNTIPVFVNKITGKNKYSQIDHDNNGNLYIVEISGNINTDKLLHIN